MLVEFRKTFKQDLRNLKDRKVRERIRSIIEEIESASNLIELRNVKAIQGYDGFYRFRAGDYRVGIYVEKGVVAFVRVLHRKEIYRYLQY
jgi:mRNA-degrading endonuclease RelE of RelBE toxin-antitoxin system